MSYRNLRRPGVYLYTNNQKTQTFGTSTGQKFVGKVIKEKVCQRRRNIEKFNKKTTTAPQHWQQ